MLVLSMHSKRVINTISTVDLDIIQGTALFIDVKVTKQLQINPISVTHFTVVSDARGALRFKLKWGFAQRRLLTVDRSMELVCNILFQILLTSISSHRIHVPIHVIMERLCNNLTIIVNVDQPVSTSPEEPTFAATASTVLDDIENTSSPKGLKILAPIENDHSINIRDACAAYFNDLVCML